MENGAAARPDLSEHSPQRIQSRAEGPKGVCVPRESEEMGHGV